jgi:hypothetical protein
MELKNHRYDVPEIYVFSPYYFTADYSTRSLVLYVLFNRSVFVLFLLAIVLSVLPLFTDSDYFFGIFNKVMAVTVKLSKCRLQLNPWFSTLLVSSNPLSRKSWQEPHAGVSDQMRGMTSIMYCLIDRCLSFFFWPLCCLSFLYLRILITSLVYSSSSSDNARILCMYITCIDTWITIILWCIAFIIQNSNIFKSWSSTSAIIRSRLEIVDIYHVIKWVYNVTRLSVLVIHYSGR